jgi:putative endonuclease
MWRLVVRVKRGSMIPIVLPQVWFVYILRCGDGSLYTGSTNRLAERLTAHQAGKGAKYTRSHLPVELVYHETVASRSAALQREVVIKKMTKTEKLALLATAAWNKTI